MYLFTHACPQGPKFGNKVSVFCASDSAAENDTKHV